MATADFEFSMTAHGNTNELCLLANILKHYTTDETNVYFRFAKLQKGNEIAEIAELNNEELLDFILQNEGDFSLSASGPFGKYGELNDVDIFRDMAEAAPNAEFQGEITGNTTYTMQNLNCTLKNKILHITAYFENNDESVDAYTEYFIKKLPYKKFVKLFQLDSDEFDKYTYTDFIYDAFIFNEYSIADMDLEELLEELCEYASPELEEEEYDSISEKLEKYSLSILSYQDFCDSYDGGTTTVLDYDPIAKTYINADQPIFKSNQVYEINDLIKAYLKENGFPYDNEAVAALAVEDVYGILAGTYGKDGKSNANEDDFENDDNFDEEDDFENDDDFDDVV